LHFRNQFAARRPGTAPKRVEGMPERDCLQFIQTEIRPFAKVDFSEHPIPMDLEAETGCERLRGFHGPFERAAVDCLDRDVSQPAGEPRCLLAPFFVEVYSGGSAGDDVTQVRGCPVTHKQIGGFHPLYRRTNEAKMHMAKMQIAKMQITTGVLAAR
jgi:hypothetical protein